MQAYDASRVHVSRAVDADDLNHNSIYSVASRTVGVKVHRVIDPELTALLDDTDLSRFGSDVEEEDLEEDFVVQANIPIHLEEEEEEEDVIADKRRPINQQSLESTSDAECTEEKPRVRRLLDEQFDLVIFILLFSLLFISYVTNIWFCRLRLLQYFDLFVK